MAVFRDTWDGYNGKTWRVFLRYTDWQGKTRQHTKRGFRSKKEAQEYEREFTAKKSRDINMGFATFVNLYLEDIKPQIRITTYETKIHIVKTHILPYFSEKICLRLMQRTFYSGRMKCCRREMRMGADIRIHI